MHPYEKQLNNFNPHSPCGERPRRHAFLYAIALFQSTLPVWGATAQQALPIDQSVISIHTPRVGSDLMMMDL